MTPETINAIKESLIPVAEKMGQGAEYAWEILVWGQFAEGVATLILSLVGVVVAVLAVHWGKKRYAEDDMDMGATLAMIFGCMAVLLFGGFIYFGLIQTIAPEYSALKFLISGVTK